MFRTESNLIVPSRILPRGHPLLQLTALNGFLDQAVVITVIFEQFTASTVLLRTTTTENLQICRLKRT
ncbi:hypothetical protein V5799_007274 [Amblyomma americanum]|uniref:Uncharacterized protein n=1 Tax=Amblyomma americanum TaxID=6943 RepID=A0AAQ4DU06_AMBAM